MAASSKYAQLSSSVLLEYIYADQADLPTYTIATSIANFYKMSNAYTGEDLIFNDDDSTSITGNVRDRSVALIDTTLNKYAYLNIDGIQAYNDIDSNLTNTTSLPIGLTATDTVVYDTIRLHLVQGFNFEQKEGLIFELNVDRGDGVGLNLASQVYLEEDNHAILNASPFFFAGKTYNSYIEFKVPAIYNLNDDFKTEYLINGDSDKVSYLISSGAGYDEIAPISIKFGFIKTVEVINDQTYFTPVEQVEISLSKIDDFSGVTASVKESSLGDYLELAPLYNGENIENYITKLNNAGGDYIILHDIIVKEQVPPSGFIKTQDLQIAQVDNFDEPISFRPIIKNAANAIAYRIEYVSRLYNRNDNSQIFKTASFISQQVKKYGKSIAKINLGTNPIVSKVYNQIVQKSIELGSISSEDTTISGEKSYAKYITSFKDTYNVSVSNITLYQKTVDGEDVLVEQGESTDGATKILGQGETILQITPFDTFLKFIIYENSRDSIQAPMNLAGVGTLCMNFKTNNGETICIEEFLKGGTNKSNGEVIFKIQKAIGDQIIAFNDRNFYITSKNESNSETLIYSGKFEAPGDFTQKILQDRIKDLEQKLLESNNSIDNKNSQINDNEESINILQDTITNQDAQISANEIEIEKLEDEIIELKNAQNNITSKKTDKRDRGNLNRDFKKKTSEKTSVERVTETQKLKDVQKKALTIKTSSKGTWG